VLVGQGIARIDAIRQISIAEQTYYRWRKYYGGMGKGQLQELKRLQKENERLTRAISCPKGFDDVQLVTTGSCQHCNFKGADLNNADLYGAKLPNANLSNSHQELNFIQKT